VSRDLQEKITGFWSAVASGYEAHAGNVPRPGSEELAAWHDAVARLLPSPPADVLDIGTGTGFVAMIAAELGHRVTGIDLSEPMLTLARTESARRGLAVRFASGDAVSPDFEPATFDAVISRHLIWTLRDTHAALAAWRRLLRPGGRAIAIDGFWFADEGPDDDDGLFGSFYDREARASLPGWRYSDADAIGTLFTRAGFGRVTAAQLDEVHRAAEHPSRPSYAVVGTLD
jgi:ubiquinone/menaquinone biosynthesis C-methylase UbiE